MSTLETCRAKAEVTGDIGDLIDKLHERAKLEAAGFCGSAAGLKEGAQKVSLLGDHVRKDREEGKLDGLDEMAVAQLLQRYIVRAVECLTNLAEKKKNEEMVSHGKVAALRQSVDLVQRHHATAIAVAKQLMAPVEEPDDEDTASSSRRSRRPGEHPGQSPLDARRAVAKTKVSKKKTAKKTTRKRTTRKKATK